MSYKGACQENTSPLARCREYLCLGMQARPSGRAPWIVEGFFSGVLSCSASRETARLFLPYLWFHVTG